MLYEHFEDLPKLVAEKLITKRKHPAHPLWIYNYSPSAVNLKPDEWPEALNDCRGLILTEDGTIVGRPFRKFWNFEPNRDNLIVDGELPVVYEKLDGSLGILCFYQGERIYATRGSFESDQAKWFQNKLRSSSYPPYEPGLTYCFEIIYPANRIVVDYGDSEEVVLLAVLCDDGKELDISKFVHPFQKPKVYKFEDVKRILQKRSSVG